jgi:hypothetical protein
VCGKERKKKIENKESKISMCMREWKREERRKREKRSGNKDMRGMNQVKEKKYRVQGRMSRCW